MLAKRIIPTVLLRGRQLVKGKSFNSWRSVGVAQQAVRIYEKRSVDEMVLLDISATPSGREPDYALIHQLADECFMPLTYGGGIKTIGTVRRLLRSGADKVCLNTAAIETPNLVREIADQFGVQCVVVSIDVKGTVHSHCGTVDTGRNPVEWAQELESLGAGELIIGSIEREGAMNGYDLSLVQSVAEAVSLPVIASHGAGNYQHFLDAFNVGADAVAASSMYLFTDQTPLGAKQFLDRHGIPVRLT